MAQPTTSKFSEFIIKIGDGATPTEAFTLICGLTTKGLSITNTTASSLVPDCADEDLPAFEEKAIVSTAMPLTGTGVFTKEDREAFLDWAFDGTEKNIRVHPGGGATGEVEYYAGPAILANLEITGNRGEKVGSNMSIEFTQKPTKSLIA